MNIEKKYRKGIAILVVAMLLLNVVLPAVLVERMVQAEEQENIFDIWANGCQKLTLTDEQYEGVLDICEEYVLTDKGTAYFAALTVNGSVLRYEVDLLTCTIVGQKVLIYGDAGKTLTDGDLLYFGGNDGIYWVHTYEVFGVEREHYAYVFDVNWELQHKLWVNGVTEPGTKWSGSKYLGLSETNIVNVNTGIETNFHAIISQNSVDKIFYCDGKFLIRESCNDLETSECIYTLRDAENTTYTKIELKSMEVEYLWVTETGYKLLANREGKVMLVNVDKSFAVKDAIVLAEKGKVSQVISIPGYYLMRWEDAGETYHTLYDERWAYIGELYVPYGDTAYDNVQSITIEGIPHILTVSTWRNQIYYYLSNPITYTAKEEAPIPGALPTSEPDIQGGECPVLKHMTENRYVDEQNIAIYEVEEENQWMFAGFFSCCIEEFVVPERVMVDGEEHPIVGVVGGEILKGSPLTKLWLPATVRILPDDMFSGCVFMQDIIIEDDNPYYYSESGCVYTKDRKRLIMVAPGCEKVTVLQGVEVIETFAFYKSRAKEIELPSSLCVIQEGAFYEAELEKVEIPHGVFEIGYNAFCNCYQLKEIVVPSSVACIIDDTLFNFAHENLKIYGYTDSPAMVAAGGGKLAEAVPFVSLGKWELIEQEGILYALGNGVCCVAGYEKIQRKRIEIPEYIVVEDKRYDVKIIVSDAFQDCVVIEECVIPSTVVQIGEDVFKGCSNLEKLYIPDSVTEIAYHGEGQIIDTDNVIIYGVKGSEAQYYAQLYGVFFVESGVKPEATPYPNMPPEATVIPTPTVTPEPTATASPTMSAHPKTSPSISAKPTLTEPLIKASSLPTLINLEQIKITKIAKKGKKLTVFWEKTKDDITGYELQYSSHKKFKKKVTKTLRVSKKMSKKAFRTKKKAKKYYVRVRTYCDVQVLGVKVRLHSKWSKVKKKKIS